jgi:FAD/FMN-containing dehydrogenase
VYYPDDATYEQRRTSYWSVDSQLRPHCVVQPTSTYNVIKIVNTLVKHPACTKTEFAVRSGGQMSWGPSNNIDNGITIDLVRMNSTTFNETSRIASIQSGTLWGAVYDKLQPYGYTVAGGRSYSTGIGGFITGGGNSFFSNRYGFAGDNVKNFEVVLASGCVLHFL